MEAAGSRAWAAGGFRAGRSGRPGSSGARKAPEA
jgi:hypothetical protein